MTEVQELKLPEDSLTAPLELSENSHETLSNDTKGADPQKQKKLDEITEQLAQQFGIKMPDALQTELNEESLAEEQKRQISKTESTGDNEERKGQEQPSPFVDDDRTKHGEFPSSVTEEIQQEKKKGFWGKIQNFWQYKGLPYLVFKLTREEYDAKRAETKARRRQKLAKILHFFSPWKKKEKPKQPPLAS